MRKPKFSEVFVPGGFPRHTYNPRTDLKLELSLGQVTENLCKLVTVTGHTKSGKTVLVRQVLPRESAIWLDGGAVGSEEDFWSIIINQLDLFQTINTGQESETSTEISGAGTAGANFIIAKGEAEIGVSLSNARKKSSEGSRTVSSRIAALDGLQQARRALVIDDFHYLPLDLQGSLVRALKPLIFDGLPVVIIAIPHRRYDAIKVEKEMTGRILPVNIPAWTNEELVFIPKIGFPLLQGSASPAFVDQLSQNAIGSPHLMQEFCRSICRAHQIKENFGGKSADLSQSRLENVFHETAETIGRPIFEKLARGPRQRSDRMSRKLKNELEVDIYELVLHALAYIKPGLITLEYEDLRTAIKEVAIEDIPQLHEVARVLKHMSEIAATDQSSTPVIDFEEEEKRLHITDPFFAFFLRWGDLSG